MRKRERRRKRGREGGAKEREKEKEGRREGEGEERKGPQSWESDLLISGAILLGKNTVTWVELLKAGSQKSGLCPDAPQERSSARPGYKSRMVFSSSVAQS